MREIRNHTTLGVEHLRPHRDVQLGIVAGRALLEGAAPVGASARFHVLIRPERREIAPVRVGQQDDVSPAPAVAAVRTALRDELLTPKR
jgi:hypothetical protein